MRSELRSAAPERAVREPLVEARGVSFAYDTSSVVEDVDLTVGSGEFVALVGPNGSGKSTLLRLLLGALRPSAGTVRLFGRAPEEVVDRWRVGYVPQRPSLAPDVPASVREIVEAGRLARRGWWRRLRSEDLDAVDHALESVDLTDMAREPISRLSGGQQKRVFIARAFASEPNLLVLDEPIAGIDAESQRRFRGSLLHLIREHGAGVLLVSHELSAVADDIDRVVVLKRRVLFDGPPTRLIEEGVSLGVHPEDLPLWLEGLR
jgi:zinc transport system ATP-binding protein